MRANAMKKATRRTTKYRKKKLYNKHQAPKLVVIRRKIRKSRGRGRKRDSVILHTDTKRVLFSEHVSNVSQQFGFDRDRTTQTRNKRPACAQSSNHYYAFVVKSCSFANNESNIVLSVTCFPIVQTRFSIFEHTVLIIPYNFL